MAGFRGLRRGKVNFDPNFCQQSTQFGAVLGLKHKKLHGEAHEADTKSKQEWLESTWPALREKYATDEIWNTDESGLCFRALPNKTLTFKNDKSYGGKKSKERITILFTCSMAGEKKQLCVIGKAKNPRCFKGVQQLPVDYEANKNAWMTSVLFVKAQDLGQGAPSKKKKILLLLDNCSAHPPDVELTNIELAFLPPNTTSILQPADQGIINAAKVHYRRSICKTILEEIDGLRNQMRTSLPQTWHSSENQPNQ